MNSKQFYLRQLVLFSFVALLISACKDKEGKSVTFNLSPVTITFVNDINIDSLNTIDTFYVDTLAVNNINVINKRNGYGR